MSVHAKLKAEILEATLHTAIAKGGSLIHSDEELSQYAEMFARGFLAAIRNLEAQKGAAILEAAQKSDNVTDCLCNGLRSI